MPAIVWAPNNSTDRLRVFCCAITAEKQHNANSDNTIFLIIYFIICLLSVDILSPTFIGHVARYTPYSRSKNTLKIKVNLQTTSFSL
jgi:hypothetical protein